MNRILPPAALIVGTTLLSGCLGEPPLEERWTLLEILEATPTDAAAFSVGGSTEVTVKGRIIFREVLTGFLVAEVRASDALTTNDTLLDREEHFREKATDIDMILQNSVSLGFDAIPVTGFHHLIHDLTFTFDAGTIPLGADGMPAGAAVVPTGLFLVLYFGDVDEVELNDGSEIEVVDPTFSTDADILSTGIELVVQPQG
jgi:hypothetical protein